MLSASCFWNTLLKTAVMEKSQVTTQSHAVEAEKVENEKKETWELARWPPESVSEPESIPERPPRCWERRKIRQEEETSAMEKNQVTTQSHAVEEEKVDNEKKETWQLARPPERPPRERRKVRQEEETSLMEKNQVTTQSHAVEAEKMENEKEETWQLARWPPERPPQERRKIRQEEETSETVKTQVSLSVVEALPDEILLKIFQRLPFSTKICVLPKVCQKWKRIATDFSVITTFNFRDIPEQSIRNTIKCVIRTIEERVELRPTKLILPRVEHKYSERYTDAFTYLLCPYPIFHMDAWKYLTKFSARGLYIADKVFYKFTFLLNSEIFTELSVSDMTQLKMASIRVNLTKLRKFMIWDSAVHWFSASRLISTARDMKYLKELRIMVQKIKDPVEVKKSFWTQLQLLTLDVLKVKPDNRVLQSLGLCRKLTYLELWLPRHMRNDELCRTLSNMTQLEQLHLSARTLTHSRANEDSLFIELKNLRHVTLDIDKLQNKDVTNLCINCGHCLETIHLRLCNQLTDTAATSIITHCKKLVVLKFYWCKNINKANLLGKLAENHLPQLVLLNMILYYDELRIPSKAFSNCLTVRPQLFIKARNKSIDEISASSVLHKILGPNCPHRKRLIKKLVIHEY